MYKRLIKKKKKKNKKIGQRSTQETTQQQPSVCPSVCPGHVCDVTVTEKSASNCDLPFKQQVAQATVALSVQVKPFVPLRHVWGSSRGRSLGAGLVPPRNCEDFQVKG